MTIPIVTLKQKQILYLLYKFRYLTTYHLQKLLNHKDPHRIKEWLKDLKDKKLVDAITDPKDVTKPFIYCLDQKARHLLKADENLDETFLTQLYKEKSKSEKFINHNLFLVNVYLFFLSQKEKDSEINFFTQTDLKGYDYFPEDVPDAYISVETKEEADRYFLVLFDEYTPPGVLRHRVREYIKYSEDGDWQANTDNTPFPTILFIIPNKSLKKHIYLYTKSLLEKSFNEDFTLFLTTKETIKLNKNPEEIWEKVG